VHTEATLPAYQKDTYRNFLALQEKIYQDMLEDQNA
jgi:hypothetical protein